MIEAIELTSRNRGRSGAGRPVVDHVSFDVYPGQVTALLGAPGTGKSSVLRMMVEQEPARGRTLFSGRPYRALRPAVREVGLALDPDALHPGRTVRHHLALYAAAGGVPRARVGEVLEIAGLTLQTHARCGRLDAGQRQRLSIAAALLGDPAALLLDEPHALDAHGMAWFHALIRAYAAQGRTVLVAASNPASLAGTADHVVVLRRDEEDGHTRVIASRSAAEVFDEHRATVVIVRSPQAARLAAALEAEGATLAAAGPGALEVRSLDRARIGEIAHTAGICLHELAETGRDEEAFYGVQPPRKEIAPAPIEHVEAEDVAVGVGTGPRTGWRSGVRLIGGSRGMATIEEAEVVEPAESAEEAAAPPEAARVGDAPATKRFGAGRADRTARDQAPAETTMPMEPVGGPNRPADAETTMPMPPVDSVTGASPAGAGGKVPQPSVAAASTTGEKAPQLAPAATSQPSTAEATLPVWPNPTAEAQASQPAAAPASAENPQPATDSASTREAASASATEPATPTSLASAASYAAELAAAYSQSFADGEGESPRVARTPEEASA